MRLKYVKCCPHCSSLNVVLHSAVMDGTYKCNNCGYIGAVFEVKTDRLNKRSRKLGTKKATKRRSG